MNGGYYWKAATGEYRAVSYFADTLRWEELARPELHGPKGCAERNTRPLSSIKVFDDVARLIGEQAGLADNAQVQMRLAYPPDGVFTVRNADGSNGLALEVDGVWYPARRGANASLEVGDVTLMRRHGAWVKATDHSEVAPLLHTCRRDRARRSPSLGSCVSLTESVKTFVEDHAAEGIAKGMERDTHRIKLAAVNARGIQRHGRMKCVVLGTTIYGAKLRSDPDGKLHWIEVHALDPETGRRGQMMGSVVYSHVDNAHMYESLPEHLQRTENLDFDTALVDAASLQNSHRHLTRGQRDAFLQYSEDGYLSMNAALRKQEGRDVLNPGERRLIKLHEKLDKALSTDLPGYHGTVWRGSRVDPNWLGLPRVGDVLDVAALWSTSGSISTAKQFAAARQEATPRAGIIYEVGLRGGGAAIGFASSCKEHEVLVRKGTKFRVASISDDNVEGATRKRVRIEQVPEGEVLIGARVHQAWR